MSKAYDSALRIALVFLDGIQNPTQEDIVQKAQIAIQSARANNLTDPIDEDMLIRELESIVTITIGTGTILEDNSQHIEWLYKRKSEIKWNFWDRYIKYLQTAKLWPEKSVDGLDNITDEILRRLEDPKREGFWDTRGMVVGRVQSGKTANYTGLICKAIDTGYKVIIILSGIHKSLRSQTQVRIDEGVLGFDTQRSRSFKHQFQKIGVGLQNRGELFTIHPLTSSASNGDFNKTVAQQVTPMFGGDPVILIVKKNTSVLENIRQWALAVKSEENPNTKERYIKNIPLLLIDDEADNASINTREIPTDEEGNPLPEYEVTAINRKIRELLKIFSQSAYVGYTATPFANIFIPYDAKTETLDDDIFPRNFIINLPTPSNYIGPAEIFGISATLENQEQLPIIREVNDYENAFPPKHKKDFVPEYLPDSLIKAIHSFILVCAARNAVGKTNVHNSMLIHVTRYTAVQSFVEELVRSELNSIRKRIEFGDGNSKTKILDQLKNLWETDFVQTTEKLKKIERTSKMNLVDVPWDKVAEQLYPAVTKILIKTLNNTAKDVLDYEDNKEFGLSVIAIGGDKISRGLTLEGLSISYFIRTSRMYDTLMQMGRWFGYRPGYINLSRLYTTPQLINWYRFITEASEELLEEFNNMAKMGETPKEYGLKVRAHPDGMLITAMSKMRSGKKRQFGYDGEIAETTYYPKDVKINKQNEFLTNQFVQTLPNPNKHNGNYIWRDIPGETIASFIENYTASPLAIKANPKNLADYIKTQITKNELTSWTVVLMSGDAEETKIGGYSVNRSKRSKTTIREVENTEAYELNRRRLISPSHEYIDFTDDMKESARSKSAKEGNPVPSDPTPEAVRMTRSPKNGLLLIYPLTLLDIEDHELLSTIGFAVSFPASNTAKKSEYYINPVEADRYED